MFFCRWYMKAQKLAPKNGRPYNQLAILAMYTVSHCSFDSVTVHFPATNACFDMPCLHLGFFHTLSHHLHSLHTLPLLLWCFRHYPSTSTHSRHCPSTYIFFMHCLSTYTLPYLPLLLSPFSFSHSPLNSPAPLFLSSLLSSLLPCCN